MQERKQNKIIKKINTKYLLIAFFALLVITYFSLFIFKDNDILYNGIKIFSLFPTIVTVAVAFISSNIVIALFFGLTYSGYLYLILNGEGVCNPTNIYTSITRVALDIVTDKSFAAVILLCFLMGGFISVLKNSKGYTLFAEKIVTKINTPRKFNILTEVMALLLFFDDYANCLILGTIMKTIADKVRVSREKLSYLVDSASAPLTGISIISSWIGVELVFIGIGLKEIGSTESPYALFLRSIPYCFYCIFTLVFMMELSISKKEIGPMYEYEKKARKNKTNVIAKKEKYLNNDKNKDRDNIKILVPLLSILFFIITTIYLILSNGYKELVVNGILITKLLSFETLLSIFSYTDPIISIMQATLLSGILILILNIIFKIKTIKSSLTEYVNGMSSMIETVLVLVMAWTLAEFSKELGLIDFMMNFISGNVPHVFVPSIIFLICCVISFATGSYGCMAIVMPIAISTAHTVSNDTTFMVMCIGQVLAGSIFGDHCSPITDCTVLASKSCEVINADHVKTQMPYAIIVAMVSILCNIIMTIFNINVAIVLLLGAIILLFIIIIFGKNPEIIKKNKKEII